MKKLACGLAASIFFFNGIAFGAETGIITKEYQVPLAANNLCPKQVVETDASGKVVLQFDAAVNGLVYELWVGDLDNVRMAHLHLGAHNKKGFRVAWLYPENSTRPLLLPGRSDGLLANGMLRNQDLVGPLQGKTLQDLALSIENGQFYVDIHTADFPTGELSGHLNPVWSK